MFDNERDVSRMASQFVDLLRGFGLTAVSPCEGVQPQLMDAVAEALRQGCFCVSMLGHLNDGLKIALLEYLNSEPSQGYNVDQVAPRAICALKNISDTPIHFKTVAISRRIPQSGNLIVYSSITRKPSLSFYERKPGIIEPGAIVELPVGAANARLEAYCLPYYDRNALHQPRAPRVIDRVREVYGSLTTYGDLELQLQWGDRPGQKRPYKQRASED